MFEFIINVLEDIWFGTLRPSLRNIWAFLPQMYDIFFYKLIGRTPYRLEAVDGKLKVETKSVKSSPLALYNDLSLDNFGRTQCVEQQNKMEFVNIGNRPVNENHVESVQNLSELSKDVQGESLSIILESELSGSDNEELVPFEDLNQFKENEVGKFFKISSEPFSVDHCDVGCSESLPDLPHEEQKAMLPYEDCSESDHNISFTSKHFAETGNGVNDVLFSKETFIEEQDKEMDVFSDSEYSDYGSGTLLSWEVFENDEDSLLTTKLFNFLEENGNDLLVSGECSDANGDEEKLSMSSTESSEESNDTGLDTQPEYTDIFLSSECSSDQDDESDTSVTRSRIPVHIKRFRLLHQNAFANKWGIITNLID